MIKELKDVFPTKTSLAVFIGYMGLFVNQGLLVTASRLGGDVYPYNPIAVVLVTELVKLFLAFLIYLRTHNLSAIVVEINENKRLAIYYMVPALLYCVYNNLSFANLAVFDPTTYFMLLQTRLLLTGVFYQFFLSRRLSPKQWISIAILTVACIIQKMDWKPSDVNHNDTEVGKGPATLGNYGMLMHVGSDMILILLQVLCSVVAGVYNEYIIKRVAGSKTHLMAQNIYMCLDSIMFNLLVLIFGQTTSTKDMVSDIKGLLQGFVILIILNNSLVGIVTSLFLKHLNSVLKSLASAIEIVLTAILSCIVLGIPIYWNTVIAVVLLTLAIIIYVKNPVQSTTSIRGDDEASKSLLSKSEMSA